MARERPTPKKKPTDVRIVKFTGGDGSEQFVSFRVRVQNYEQRPVQATVSATIEGEPVQAHPEELNLLANAAPTVVSVHVPRRTDPPWVCWRLLSTETEPHVGWVVGVLP